MSDTKISAESAASTLDGSEIVPGVQSAANVKITVTQIVARVLAALRDTDATLAANSDALFATQKATKSYADAKVAGLSWKQAVRAKTTGALAANTYANGTSGVGATLTANANGALAAQDGVTLVAADRILVDSESTASHNGIYTVTQVGDGSHPYILTRATDADAGVELVNASVYVSEGTTNADTQWTCSTNATITVGSTSLAFAQLTSGGGTPGGSNKQVQFNDASAFAGDSTFTFDKSSKVWRAKIADIGTGTTFDENAISGDDTHLINITNDPAVDAGVGTSGHQLIRVNSYASAGYGGDVHFCRYRGSAASPTAVQSGDTFMSFGMRGWDSSGALGASSASFAYQATENHTVSAHGGEWHFGVTANGSTTRNNIFFIGSYGIKLVAGAVNEAVAVTIASSSAPAIGAALGNTINLTGTTTVTGFDTVADGVVRRVIFGGILTLTHNGTSLILPTAANITTAAGDVAEFVSKGSGNWKCLSYTRADGTALASVGSGQSAIQFKDEGSNAGSSGAITSVNFVGANVTAAAVGSALTVTITGGSTNVNSANVKATYTRPADTTTYAAGDVLADSTSAATMLSFANFASTNGGGARIESAQMIDSVAAATKADLELWLFDATISMQNDNAAWNPSDSDMLHCVGKIYFPSGANTTAGANCMTDVDGLAKQITCAGGATTIYGAVVVRNAYIPTSGEVFQFNLQIIQTP